MSISEEIESGAYRNDPVPIVKSHVSAEVQVLRRWLNIVRFMSCRAWIGGISRDVFLIRIQTCRTGFDESFEKRF